jgi:hypothetical protein
MHVDGVEGVPDGKTTRLHTGIMMEHSQADAHGHSGNTQDLKHRYFRRGGHLASYLGFFGRTCLYAGPYKTALSQYIPAWQSGFAQRMPLPRKDLRLQDRGKPSALSSENVG